MRTAFTAPAARTSRAGSPYPIAPGPITPAPIKVVLRRGASYDSAMTEAEIAKRKAGLPERMAGATIARDGPVFALAKRS